MLQDTNHRRSFDCLVSCTLGFQQLLRSHWCARFCAIVSYSKFKDFLNFFHVCVSLPVPVTVYQITGSASLSLSPAWCTIGSEYLVDFVTIVTRRKSFTSRCNSVQFLDRSLWTARSLLFSPVGPFHRVLLWGVFSPELVLNVPLVNCPTCIRSVSVVTCCFLKIGPPERISTRRYGIRERTRILSGQKESSSDVLWQDRS